MSAMAHARGVRKKTYFILLGFSMFRGRDDNGWEGFPVPRWKDGVCSDIWPDWDQVEFKMVGLNTGNDE